VPEPFPADANVGHADAFISHSHENQDFAARLRAALREAGKEAWVDSDIPSGDRWEERIRGAIETSDSFIFVISPASVISPECLRELSYATDLNKKLIPVYFEQTTSGIPAALMAVQFVPPRGLFNGGGPQSADNAFETSLAVLISVIDTDLDATREHTEWGNKALEWERKTRERSLLLSGRELEAAEHWLARAPGKGPHPTELQRAYVTASRRAATKRQRRLLSGVSVALVVALVLAGIALLQRSHALDAERTAESGQMAAEATTLLTRNAPLSAMVSVKAGRRAPTTEARDALAAAAQLPIDGILNDGGDVNTVAYSPDGTMIATAADDPNNKRGRVVIWSRTSHKKITWHDGSFVSALAFSPDGKTIATGDDDGHVRVWNVATGTNTTWKDGSAVDSLAFDPADGEMLVTGDEDGHVRFWDVTTGTKTTHDDSSSVTSIAFSPDGDTLAVGDAGGILHVTDMANGQYGDGVDVSALDGMAFSPNGKLLVTGDANGNVVSWDIENLPDSVLDHGAVWNDGTVAVYSVAFSPDGKTVATGDDDAHVRLWDVANGTYVTRTDGSAVNGVAFSPDGKILAAGDNNGQVVMWPVNHSAFTMRNVGSTAQSVEFSPNGKVLVIGDIGQIVLLSAASGERETWSDGSSLRAVVSPNSEAIASGDYDGHVRLWDPASGKATTWNDGSVIYSEAFSPDSKTLATGDNDGHIRLWDVATGSKTTWNDKFVVETVAFSPDGKTVASGDEDGQVRVWNVSSGTKTTWNVGDTVRSVAFTPDGKTLVSADNNGQLRLWDVATGTYTTFNDGSEVPDLAISPDGKYLATGDSSGNVRIWNMATGAKITWNNGPGVGSVAFSPDGKTLAAGDELGGVSLYSSLIWKDSFNALELRLCNELGGYTMSRNQWATYIPAQSYSAICSS
jgi:WD40 repeat protein